MITKHVYDGIGPCHADYESTGAPSQEDMDLVTCSNLGIDLYLWNHLPSFKQDLIAAGRNVPEEVLAFEKEHPGMHVEETEVEIK